jgi:F-box-like
MYAYPRNRQCSSPTNNLPIELLSHIFSLSTHPTTGDFPVTTGEYSPPTITTESVQVPLILSSVNRLWRQVALGTPSLWSSLCITVELVQTFYCIQRDPSGCTISKQLNTSHITSYLALSRKYPLNILIDARDENWNFEPECVIPFLASS